MLIKMAQRSSYNSRVRQTPSQETFMHNIVLQNVNEQMHKNFALMFNTFLLYRLILT